MSEEDVIVACSLSDDNFYDIGIDNYLSDHTDCKGREKLVKIISEGHRNYLSVCPQTAPELLTILAKDGYVWIRRNVAKNPNTPPAVLELLSHDREVNATFTVASGKS